METMRNTSNIDLRQLVLKTIERYNRYRSPEATANLLSLEEESFTLEFKGAFCQSCGVQDYFEDFIYELKELGTHVELKIKGIEQTSPQSFKVQYAIEKFSV